jgi:hypothetical protein
MVSAQMKQKTTGLFSIFCLVVLLAGLLICPRTTLAQSDAFYNKNFTWDYNGQHWTWNLSVPLELYDAYKTVPVSNRTQYGAAGYGFCTTTEDPYVQSLAKELNDTSNRLGYDAFDKVSFILSFVQSLPYTSDSVTTGFDEYPRFPLETLVDDGGDCEDSSILLASLTLILGFKTVYINPPGHYAVGISGNNLRGTYWTYPEGSNNTYYYCETTGNYFMIGEMPSHYIGQSVNIYTLNESKQYIPQLVLTSPSDLPDSFLMQQNTTPQPTHVSDVSSPTVSQPINESILPLPSLSVVTDNPFLYFLGIFSIVVSFGFVLSSKKRRPKAK